MSKPVVGNALTRALLNGINEGTTPLECATLNTVRTTVTGNQDNYNWDSGASSPQIAFQRNQWNGASDVTWRGFAGGVAGRWDYLENITSAKAMIFKHEDTGSTAANRLKLPGGISSVAVGPGGLAMRVYDATDSRWRIFVLDPGNWIDVAHAGANFTASSGTWTVDSGDQTIFRYRQHGNQLTYDIALTGTSVSATPSFLRIALVNGLVCAGGFGPLILIVDNAVRVAGRPLFNGTDAYISLERMDGGAFAAATNTTTIQGLLIGKVA